MIKIDNTLEESTVIDAHFDLLLDVAKQRQRGRIKIIESDYLDGFRRGGLNIVVSSLFVEQKYLPEMALRVALEQVSALYSEIDESKDKIMLCKNYKDIETAREKDKIGIMLSFEGVEPIYNDLLLLRIFYELGVRCIGLTWSRRNLAADGCTYGEVKQEAEGGLTGFGKDLIEAAENIGMIIDVSHLNCKGFWDVMEAARKPVIASHSNCCALAKTARNLNDDQIRAIASKGGVIGVNAANILTADADENANIEGLIKHIDHIVKLVGTKHVGFGFDFCYKIIEGLCEDEQSNMPRKIFDIFEGHKELKRFTGKLMNHGYSPKDIELIAGDNFKRVFRETLKDQ